MYVCNESFYWPSILNDRMMERGVPVAHTHLTKMCFAIFDSYKLFLGLVNIANVCLLADHLEPACGPSKLHNQYE